MECVLKEDSDMKQDMIWKVLCAIVVMVCGVLVVSAIPAGAWPVPDTGQTTSYAVGDDGYYSVNPRSYTDNGNGTVTDNFTKLVWQQQDDGQARGGEEAKGYCDASTLGGFSDWRLPTVQELVSLVDHSVWNPAIDDGVFPGTVIPSTTGQFLYWSSTSNWLVDFYYGHVYSSKSNYYVRVRCVRSGPDTKPFDPLVVNNSATATDVNTGLSWQRQDNGQAINWKEALTYCEELTMDGFSDWRLPTVNELQSLADYGTSSPAIDQTVFPGTSWSGQNPGQSRYWSSTTYAFFGYSTSDAWNVLFIDGEVHSYGKTGNSYARCVRSGPINRTLGALSISSPSQGSTFKNGTIHITWSDPQNIGGQVSISLSSDGGKTWETITTSTANDGVYDWAVTGLESVNCVLKVEPIGATDKVGYKGLFSIATGSVTTSTTTLPTTTTTSTTTVTSTTTTTTIPLLLDQPNSTIRIYPVDGDIQDYYSINDTVKLKATYRDQEGFDLDATGLANWVSTNSLIATVGNGVSKGGSVTFKGNGEVYSGPRFQDNSLSCMPSHGGRQNE